MVLQSSKSAQLRGSMSSAAGSRPGEHRGEGRSALQTAGPKQAANARRSDGSPHGASASTTSCPSERSSSAASSVGLERAGVDRGVHGDCRRRRRCGGGRARPWPGPRRARSGGGAHAASPSSGPARTSSACAVSAHRAREHAVEDEGQSADSGASEIAAALRLEPDEPAAGGGDPDRAAAVVAVGERDHAGGDRGRRAAGGAARRPRRGPRGCASAPNAARLGDRQDPALGQRGRADDHEARVAQAAHDVVVERRDEVARGASAPKVSRPAGDGAVVLDRDRHAGERPLVAGPDRVGVGERLLGRHVDERVDRGSSAAMRSSDAWTSSRAESCPERTSARRARRPGGT